MRDTAQSLGQPSSDSSSPTVAVTDPKPEFAAPDRDVTEDMGRLTLTENLTVYTGSSHWITILEDVSLLLEYLGTLIRILILPDPTSQR